MHITEDCIKCLNCVHICPQTAIRLNANGQATIDMDICIECGVCLDSASCPATAIKETDDTISLIKKSFGRMISSSLEKKKSGRIGKLDLKTCDAKGGLPASSVDVRLELGRPMGAVRIGQAESLRIELIQLGYNIVVQSNYRKLLHGDEMRLPQDLESVRILSTCFEATISEQDLPKLLNSAEKSAKRLHLSLVANALLREDQLSSVENILADYSIKRESRVKANLGLASDWQKHRLL